MLGLAAQHECLDTNSIAGSTSRLIHLEDVDPLAVLQARVVCDGAAALDTLQLRLPKVIVFKEARFF